MAPASKHTMQRPGASVIRRVTGHQYYAFAVRRDDVRAAATALLAMVVIKQPELALHKPVARALTCVRKFVYVRRWAQLGLALGWIGLASGTDRGWSALVKLVCTQRALQ
jgi:hypothetical protein